MALHIHERISAQAILRVAARQDPLHRLLALNFEISACDAGAATRSENHDR